MFDAPCEGVDPLHGRTRRSGCSRRCWSRAGGGEPRGAPGAARTQRRERCTARSCREIEVPTDATGRCGSTTCPGRRVTVTTWRQLKPRALPIVLTPYVLPGGLGEHKWRDRRLLDALSADGTTPLILDADGTVLEAAWASVLIRRDGVLYTPREDGRILPSTSRPDAALRAGPAPAARRRAVAQLDLSRESCRPCSRPPARNRRPVRVVLRAELLPERRLLVAAHEGDERSPAAARRRRAARTAPKQQRLADDGADTTATYIGLRTWR